MFREQFFVKIKLRFLFFRMMNVVFSRPLWELRMHNERLIQRHESDISVRIASIGLSAVTFSFDVSEMLPDKFSLTYFLVEKFNNTKYI